MENNPRFAKIPVAKTSGRSAMDPKLFSCIIDMMALVEGGIVETTSAQFERSANNASYGILLNSHTRLMYGKTSGLYFVKMKKRL